MKRYHGANRKVTAYQSPQCKQFLINLSSFNLSMGVCIYTHIIIYIYMYIYIYYIILYTH